MFELDSVRREREIRLESAFFIEGGCCGYSMVVRFNNVESIKDRATWSCHHEVGLFALGVMSRVAEQLT